jgi:predicted TIM-barrel fold metal-dependent hydrolase
MCLPHKCPRAKCAAGQRRASGRLARPNRPGSASASRWSPKYFPPPLVRAAGSYLQDKMLFGTDYPLLTPERWLRDFELLGIKPEIRPKILKHNAARLLGLAG